MQAGTFRVSDSITLNFFVIDLKATEIILYDVCSLLMKERYLLFILQKKMYSKLKIIIEMYQSIEVCKAVQNEIRVSNEYE